MGENESGSYPELKAQLLGKVGDFMKVSGLLQEAGISFIPLKGPALSYRLYGDMSYRNFGDLDFLLDRPAIEEAIPLLKKAGYSCQQYDWHVKNQKADVFFKHFHHVVLRKPDSNIHLEMHWRLFNYKFAGKGIENEMISKNLEEIAYRGQRFSVFNPELELLYLIMHGGLHAWQWLRWLLDIHVFLHKVQIDEDKFTNLVNKVKAQKMISLCNALLKDYFPDGKLLPCKQKASPYLYKFARAQLENEAEGDFSLGGRFRMHAYRMQCFPGIKYKWSVFQHILFYPEQLDDERLAGNRLLYYLGGMIKKVRRRL